MRAARGEPAWWPWEILFSLLNYFKAAEGCVRQEPTLRPDRGAPAFAVQKYASASIGRMKSFQHYIALSGVQQRPVVGEDLNALSLEAFFYFRSQQHIRSGERGQALLHAGNHVRAVKPVGFRQVRGRVIGGMIGVGMIKADDVLAAVARQLDGGDHLLGMDAVTVGWGVTAHVLAGQGHGYQAMHVNHVPRQNAAARMGIAALGFPTNQIVISLADFQHGGVSWEVAASPVHRP